MSTKAPTPELTETVVPLIPPQNEGVNDLPPYDQRSALSWHLEMLRKALDETL